MAEKPILFSGEMVRAILEGRKTVTRRVVKPPPSSLFTWHPDVNLWVDGEGDIHKCPYGKPGDTLWVRETWIRNLYKGEVIIGRVNPGKIAYRADGHKLPYGFRWTPSIFMPRWASRITLRVTGVEVKRLWDMAEYDMNKEGVDSPPEDEPVHWVTPFKLLWDSINAKRGYGWDTNPFVWVVEFEVID